MAHHKEFNAFMIRYITRLFNERDYTSLKTMQVKPELAKEIASMSVSDSERLSSFNSPLCELPSFDASRFSMLVKHSQREGVRSDIVDRMIKLDASQVMLYELAGIERTEYRGRRRGLNLPPASSGRPSSITEAQATRLHEAWHEHSDESDLLVRYFKVGVATGISLAQIWQHMHSQN